MNNLFDGLTTVVQYRREDEGVVWTTMAAFDNSIVAENYAKACAKKCTSDNSPWDYRVKDCEVEQKERINL